MERSKRSRSEAPKRQTKADASILDRLAYFDDTLHTKIAKLEPEVGIGAAVQQVYKDRSNLKRKLSYSTANTQQSRAENLADYRRTQMAVQLERTTEALEQAAEALRLQKEAKNSCGANLLILKEKKRKKRKLRES